MFQVKEPTGNLFLPINWTCPQALTVASSNIIPLWFSRQGICLFLSYFTFPSLPHGQLQWLGFPSPFSYRWCSIRTNPWPLPNSYPFVPLSVTSENTAICHWLLHSTSLWHHSNAQHFLNCWTTCPKSSIESAEILSNKTLAGLKH